MVRKRIRGFEEYKISNRNKQKKGSKSNLKNIKRFIDCLNF